MAKLTPGRVPARVVFRQSREHYRFDPPNLLLTTLKVAAAIAVVSVAVRSTTFTDYNAPKQPTVFQPPNTLLTLLAPPKAAVVVQTPFNQEDWPNPAKPWQRDLTWIDTPQVIPQVPDVAVANRIPNQTDWPNPQRPWIRDLTWTQSPAVPPALIAAVPAPFAQEDWPNPLRSPIRDLTWTQTPEAIPPVVIPPVIVAQAPFDQTDWPNPLRSPVRDLTWTQSPKVQQIVAGAAAAEGQRAHGFTDYFAKQQPVVFDPPNTLLALLSTPVVVAPASTVKPFLQADWPNPVARIPFRESGWIRFANIGDIPAQAPPPVVAAAPPFSQEDWPNPRLRPTRIKTPEAFRPALDSPTVTTAATTSSFPFSQEDWPNPFRRISPREWGFTRFANVSDIPQRFIAPAPFDQTDWPNPLTPWRRDLTWLQSPQVQQIVPDAAGSTFPFSLLDQPNPVLRTPFNESGWVRFANIGDIPAAAPPVPVPPAPTDEVKPSGGRVQPDGHKLASSRSPAGTIDPEFRYAIEGRKTYAQKLKDLRIAQEAAEVIEQVALQQAATLEVDEAKNARELKRALRVAQLEDDARYLGLLAERRELAKTEEIGALLYKAVRDEEDILALLMIAAQLL